MEARDMSLVEKAYNGIAEMIFSFQLPPGSKVSDFSLSRKLGISRTPIRSAILLLMNHGLVIKTHDGYEVPKITAESIDEIYDARICIETAIVDFSIRNNLHCKKIKELRRLISLQKSAADSGDIFQSTDYSLRFHKALVGMCENESLEDLFSHLYLPMKIINVLA
ncbi:MAG: GntR family transcriptional regulator, partial [Spirochaetales bacterium]|nr:GntR family transcriptional regulator [Spirochaetales bacterium]